VARNTTAARAHSTRRGLPLSAVTVTDEFWERRREVNREVTLENQLSKLDGRIENLKRAGGLSEGGFEGPYHNDPPVYKWVEAACYELEREHDPELRDEVDRVVEVIAAAQQDDGYLHSNFILDYDSDERFTNLHTKHELFALGHLAEAAVAHHRATGDDTLLETAKGFADLACETFGPDGKVGYPGHPETELALVRLYRETGVERYLDLAKFFVDERGREDSRFAWEIDNEDEVAGGVHEGLYCDDDGEYDGSYSQDHLPVREQDTVEGHAVKATFLYAGMADVAAETGDESLLDALETLWSNMTERRTYVTGGIGARGEGEAFGDDYELPNDSAYAETCAAFGSIIWNQRMLGLTGGGRFADLIERTLYNGFLAGVSLDGTQFCYTNPLESDGGRHRQPWYHTSCCPPNVARLLASLERYVYSQDDGLLAVDQFVDSTAETDVDGVAVELTQSGDLPWGGDVAITVEAAEPTEFDFAVRIPGWADDATLTVNGETVAADDEVENGYVRLSRTWDDDEVHLELPMDVERLATHPSVAADAGRVVLTRGPLVYCFEETDNPRPPHQLSLSADFEATTRFEDDLLEGVVVIDGSASAPDMDGWDAELYRPVEETATEPVEVSAVPYYAWDNRDPGGMQVWIRSDRPE
jgi:DUF1680 family protein